MAIRLPEMEKLNSPLAPFAKVEEQIRSLFDTILRTVTERRDQLLLQLYDLKIDYLEKEEMRMKQVQDLEKMAKQLMEMSIHQNLVVKLQEEHLNKTKDELKKSKQPTPVPVPGFRTEDLQSLLQQLERIGIVQELGGLYIDKQNPVRTIGNRGSKKGEFEYPYGICLDADKRVYVCDCNNERIQVFSKDNKFLTEFGKEHLDTIYGIALHDRWVFVSDWGLNTVLKFRISDYKLVSMSDRGVLNEPFGLTVDSNGEVLVADCDNDRITVLNSDLEFVRKIGEEKLKYPRDVKIHSNKIFVADNSKPYNVHVFSESADLLYSMINLKDGTSDIFMCFDQFNNILISDSWSNSIQIFTLEGQLLHSIECEGSPTGIAVTNDNTIVCGMDFLHSVNFY